MKANKLKKLVSVAIAFCAAALYAELPDPIAWWKMDAIVDGKVSDASGNQRDLTLGVGCSLTNDAVSGAAIYWNGTTDAWGSFACPKLRSRTLSLWVRRDALRGPIPEDVNTFPYLFAALSNMRVHFDGNDSRNGTTVYLPNDSPKNFSVARQSWHHVVLILEEEAAGTVAFRVYQDGGLQVNEAGLPAGTLEAATTAYLGNNGGAGATRPIHALLDDVRLFDSAITGEQVLELGREHTADGAKLMMRWNLADAVASEGGGWTVPDATGNGSTLIIQKDVSFTNGVDASSPALWFNGTENTLVHATNRYPFVARELTVAGWMRQSENSGTPPISGNEFNRFFGVLGHSSAYVNFKHGHSIAYYGINDVNTGVNGMNAGYGGWGHFAITFDLHYDTEKGDYYGTPVFYRNGELVLTGAVQRTSSIKGLPTGNRVYIGSAGAANRVFYGAMADFQVYDGVLSPERIRALYAGAAKPDAGADFSVANSRATLCGLVAPSAGGAGNIRRGYAGVSTWSLVRAPQGGEGAAIDDPAAERTAVTLPVTGEYVFRLTVSNGEGNVKSDDVTVTRVAPTGKAVPSIVLAVPSAAETGPFSLPVSATAQDPGGNPLRYRWTCVSGPGAVRFADARAAKTSVEFDVAGEYVIACAADNGETSARAEAGVPVTVGGHQVPGFLDEGLLGYWSFDDSVAWRDRVSKTDGGSVPNTAVVRQTPGVSGTGMGNFSTSGAAYFNTNAKLQEEGTATAVPTSPWRTFSFWMYHDPTADVSQRMETALVNVNQTLGIRYNCENGGDGFTLYHQGPGGAVYKMRFARPETDPKGRWTHVVVNFDRMTAQASNQSELWIDGVRQVATNGLLGAARKMDNAIYLAGMSAGAAGSTHDEWNGAYVIDGVVYSRAFPGVIDEVRLYDRKLSEAEIKWLAQHPDVMADAGPVASGLSAEAKMTKKSTKVFAPVVGFEGANPSYKWEVIAGDPAGLAIEDADQEICTVTGLRAGIYKLRLIVSDGRRRVCSDPVTVEVQGNGMVILLK